MTRSFKALLLVLTLIGGMTLAGGVRASSGALTYEEARAIICFPGSEWSCPVMLGIAVRESGLDNTAVNKDSGCACLFQIHPIHGNNQGLLTSDPYACTAAAYRLFLAAGYTPWRATE